MMYSSFSAFSTRLFSVLRFESVIHEFDPYFNYRTTRYLAEEGFYKFHNWFDDRAWYPLGRIIGGKRKISHCKVLISHAVFHLRNHLPWFDGDISSSLSFDELAAHFN